MNLLYYFLNPSNVLSSGALNEVYISIYTNFVH